MKIKSETHLSKILKVSTCPACGHHVAVNFFDGGDQPLATLAWPKSVEEAQGMLALPLSFVQCVNCSHVYNSQFDYKKVPYSDHPNLMFNSGALWGEHLNQISDLIFSHVPENPTIVEIGCGNGQFLSGLANLFPTGKYIGFDPNSKFDQASEKADFRPELFEPNKHLEEIAPDMIISRHVLEHLMNPLAFLQTLAFSADWLQKKVKLFIEVPCIDRVFETKRIADFYYEHNSHFTTFSFTRLLEQATSEIIKISHGYDREVIFGMATLGGSEVKRDMAQKSSTFYSMTQQSKSVVSSQLQELYHSGKMTAIWGGTGKASAFMNYFNVSSEYFPIVVDSDYLKVGTFVPGLGQEILPPEYLLSHPVDTIIIPTQWRAKDIIVEIKSRGIHFKSILIEHEGKLIDFFNDFHPYS